MGDFPNVGALPVTIWTGSKYSVGCVRGLVGGSSGFTSLAWGTAGLAVLLPVFLPFRYPVQNLFVYNFATVAGNFDVGIYNTDFVLLASAGSTVMAGASAMQFVAKDIILDPGQYYLALSSNSTTATYACSQSASATRARYFGALMVASGAMPLLNPTTPVATTVGRIPLIGFTRLSGTPSF